MKQYCIATFSIYFLCLTSFVQPAKPKVWGFYSHRMINRMAVFTLPTELFGFYRSHIDYITEHAVDPDKRRYASKFEDIRHYIDLDHWGTYPYRNLTRDFEDDIIRHSIWTSSGSSGADTLHTEIRQDTIYLKMPTTSNEQVAANYLTFLKFWKKNVKPLYYDDQWLINRYDLDDLFSTDYFTRNKIDISITDHFSQHGILPYYLEEMMIKLTKAFENKNVGQILRLSADLGHYIGDAHVPLHTTSNYNGQLTGQYGIHALWETKIPELLAEDHYSFFTGGAEYIQDVKSHFWNAILTSNSYVGEVLEKEISISGEFESDAQFCFSTRLSTTVKTQCPEFVRAYSTSLGTMVEDRMVSAAYSLGSCILTAWVNAGQPKLSETAQPDKEIEIEPNPSNVTPREHDSGSKSP